MFMGQIYMPANQTLPPITEEIYRVLKVIPPTGKIWQQVSTDYYWHFFTKDKTKQKENNKTWNKAKKVFEMPMSLYF